MAMWVSGSGSFWAESSRLGLSWPLLDDVGYMSLEHRRRIDRGTVSIQYVRPYDIMGQDIDLYANFYYQEQQSNLGLFDVDDVAGALGIGSIFE